MNSNRLRGALVCSLLVILLLAAGCTLPAGPSVIPATPSVAPTLTTEPVPQGSSKEEMVAFVQEATAYAKAHGREKALAEFSDPRGSFFRGDLYIYAYDYSGLTLAHPVNLDMIGVNRLEERDANGKLFIRELMDASTDGIGFVEFTYINPTQNKRVEKKLGYVIQVDEDWWLGSGIYFGPVDPSLPDSDEMPDE